MSYRLLVVSQYWEPAERAGGARSTGRAVAELAGAVDTWVIAGDRDVGDVEPWPDVAARTSTTGAWAERGGALVRYQPWDLGAGRRVRRAIDEVAPHVVYLPSLFAPGSLAVLSRCAIGRVRVPVVVAPEGELHPGALAHHAGRKRAVLALLRAARVGRRVWWRAADEHEAAQIREVMGSRASVVITPDLHDEPNTSGASVQSRSAKVSGVAGVVFIGSIVPKKRLHRALELLWPLRHQVRFDIYGPVVDAAEWARCQEILDRCEPDVEWQTHGTIPHGDVQAVLAEADLCILPTLGENYSYVIAEALGAGCPVLISDQTPWRGLDGWCGWDLPLEPVEAWRSCVGEVVAWDDDDRRRAAVAARQCFDRARQTSEDTRGAWLRLIEAAATSTLPR